MSIKKRLAAIGTAAGLAVGMGVVASSPAQALAPYYHIGCYTSTYGIPASTFAYHKAYTNSYEVHFKYPWVRTFLGWEQHIKSLSVTFYGYSGGRTNTYQTDGYPIRSYPMGNTTTYRVTATYVIYSYNTVTGAVLLEHDSCAMIVPAK